MKNKKVHISEFSFICGDIKTIHIDNSFFI
jgi:hypothetical protein